MATPKKKQEKFAEQEIEEEAKKDEDRLRVGGAWRNEDKNGNGYLVTPFNEQSLDETIAFLQDCKDKNLVAKMITYTNGFRTDEKHPQFITYMYPVVKKEKEAK